MGSGSELVPVGAHTAQIPIAQMRSVYRVGDVEKRLDKLPAREHENLRATYERMLEKGPERFQVKPSGLPAMDHLYDELPNFDEVLDDLKRQLVLCTRQPRRAGDHADAAAGPAGHRQDPFRAARVAAAGHRAGLHLDELADRRLGAQRSRPANGRARGRARSSRRWSTAPTPTR